MDGRSDRKRQWPECLMDLTWIPSVLQALIGPYGVVVVLLVAVVLMGRVLLDLMGRLVRGELVSGELVAELMANGKQQADAFDKIAAVADAQFRALDNRRGNRV